MITLKESSPIIPSLDVRSLIMVVHGAGRYSNGLGILGVDTQFVTGDLHLTFRRIKPQQELNI